VGAASGLAMGGARVLALERAASHRRGAVRAMASHDQAGRARVVRRREVARRSIR